MKKILSGVLALSMIISTLPFQRQNSTVEAAYGTGKNVVEYLNRGAIAVNTGNGMLVSWRFLANDDSDAEYKLYRDGTLVYTSQPGMPTCYLDNGGNSSSEYKVEYISNGQIIGSEKCLFKSDKNYFDIPLNVPASSDCTYSANDCSVGDVDGDGTYELFVKWDPSNSQDNSFDGYTGNVYIDCYTITGKQLWRIDLGKNIRAGAHYTQFLVADFDCDGKAEMTCKTADGTVDGTGKVIGDQSKDYRNSSGYILSGPEYYTLFEGATGKALDTVNYEYPRGEVSKQTWGDNYGNRVDRFLGAVMYCDGVKPSAVSVRGYYTRMTAVAYDVVDKKLVKRWGFDTGFNSSAPGYGNGNHNAMPADVDNDGKQELVLGSTCIDDNGTLLWCNNNGHGDALHVSDFLPDREGLELWMCHEVSPFGVSLIDAKTGQEIFRKTNSKDTGRACAGNIIASNPGAEFWGAVGNNVFDKSGNVVSTTKPGQNFMIYWDGDLEREILDGITISKYTETGKINTILSADGCASNNGTKSNPGLTADIFGDWREELVLRTEDSKYLRIYSTTYETDVRLTTLMHDVHYRTQVAAEQSGYNQPAHTGFYLGSDAPLPQRPAVTINGSMIVPDEPSVTPPVTVVPPQEDLKTDCLYMIKNVNSGQYLNVSEDSNVAQSNTNTAVSSNTWKLVSAGNGYYYIYSQTAENMVLDVAGKKTANGTNILVYTFKEAENQQFKFNKNRDGSYKICTKISGNNSCVEVVNGSSENGANVQQYEINGFNCQDWLLEPVTSVSEPIVTTVTTTTTTNPPSQVTTVTTTTSDSPQDTVVYGDIDGNGNVDLTDLTVLSLYLLGDKKLSENALLSADVNGSGAVDVADLAHMKQYISREPVILGPQ